MVVYAVKEYFRSCPIYEGDTAITRIFSTKEKAQFYIDNIAEDECEIITYDLD